MTFRDHMMQNNNNLSWCIPYSFLGGKVKLAINEGEICGLMIDGETIPCTPENIKTAAKLVNPDYSEYRGRSDTDIILDAVVCDELPCRCCPWFCECDAMDGEYEGESDGF